LGIDFGLFNNRIAGTIEAYYKRTTDLLWEVPLPLESGFGTSLTNIGKIDNKGIEFTLNTVKIRNWDETISTVPPYTLVNNSFQNWRGMQESGGRRVNKNIFLDMTTLKFCTPEMLDNIRKEVPLMADYQPAEGEVPTNAQLYRIYIERYLCSLPVVNQEMDLIISQKEPTTYGVPIQVYFFSRNKVWKEYERIQSSSTTCW
jgi:small-conductance mechanosensitive channel